MGDKTLSFKFQDREKVIVSSMELLRVGVGKVNGAKRDISRKEPFQCGRWCLRSFSRGGKKNLYHKVKSSPEKGKGQR